MRRFWLAALVVLLAASLGGAGFAGIEEAGAQAKRPNIVFIMTDDASMDVLARMPTIQSRMTKLGTKFPNAIYPTPWCGPSRATMLTGRYPHNHGVGFCGGTAWEVFKQSETDTFATRLKNGGYRTGYVGKYVNGYGGYGTVREDTTTIPDGWGAWYGYLGDYGIESTYRVNENGTVRSFPRSYHDTDYMADRATGFIRAGQGQAQPWMLTVAPNAPHTPTWAAARHKSAFRTAPLPKRPNFDEADVSDKGSYVRGQPRLSAAEVGQMTSRHRQRLRAMLSVDEMVGKVLDALRATGQMPNTYVFLWNDNGYHLGEHRLREGKLMPYEEDVRYPLLVRGPGVPVGKVRPELVSATDIGPTFWNIGGVSGPEPDAVDGRSLLPLLSHSPPEEWRSAVLLEFGGADHPAAPPPYKAVRTDDTKYVEWQGGTRELYGLPSDPFELQGGVGDPERASALERRIRELEGCAGDSCRAAEDGP